MLYQDDCLDRMKKIPAGSVDMVYLDPPFFTQKDQCLCNEDGKKYSFSDHWASREEYLAFMEKRLVEIHRVLKDSGSVFLHCDTRSSYYMRLLLDHILGEKNFRSEIIWSYKRWSNSRNGLLPAHQTILMYTKTDHYKFHVLYGEYSPTTNLDQILQMRERNETGKVVYKKDTTGKTVMSEEKRGVPLSDVWEIPFLNPKAKERTGYPTQKPVELLERIVRISTDEGDLVMDPFCGSGTTLVAAKRLNRSYIGIDCNPDAIEISKERLDKPIKSESRLLEKGIDSYRTKDSYEISILQQLDCDIVQRNHGIDGLLKKHINGSPVAVRIQKENEKLGDAAAALYKAGKKRNCSYMFLVARSEYQPSEVREIPDNLIILNSMDLQAEYLVRHKQEAVKRPLSSKTEPAAQPA